MRLGTAPPGRMTGHPVAWTSLAALALADALTALAFSLPLNDVAEHVAGHLAVAVPALGLLAVALWRWPPPSADVSAARLRRTVLLAGLGIAGGALVLESAGAFGFGSAGDERNPNLVVLHDVAVLVSPFGIMLLLAGTFLSVAVHLACRGGAVRSGYLTGGVVLAVVAVLAFWGGALVFGY